MRNGYILEDIHGKPGVVNNKQEIAANCEKHIRARGPFP